MLNEKNRVYVLNAEREKLIMGKLHVHCVGQRQQSTKGNYVGMEQECLILTDSARYVESLYIKITKYVKSITTIWFI